MQRSTDRILATHVGSLARPHDLLDTMKEKENGRPYDAATFDRQVRDAVADVVRRQAGAGLDVVTDGEQSKVSFATYVKDRLDGFDATEGESLKPPSWQAEIDAFPEYYADYLGKYKSTVAPMRVMVCTGPIAYTGHDLLRTDIANLQAAVDGLDDGQAVAEVFLPSASPGGFGRNEYYPTHEDYLTAIAEAMRTEYTAILDAGLLLQIDDPWLVELLADPAHDPDNRRRHGERHVEILNHALRGLPVDRIRLHTCYGLNHGPRLSDLPLRDVADLMLQVTAGAYSFEVANPRHQHEWRVWQDVKLPDGAILIPGLLGHATNYVEHPQLIADQLVTYAGLVGRENVIAGADCGFSSRASYKPEVHPTVVWEKFKALAEGAALASEQLWR